MSFAFDKLFELLATGGIDFSSDDIRVALVDSTTTVDTETDVALMNGFSTLGELSGTGYIRKALANEAVTLDNANDRAEFDADDVTWTALDAGTIEGILVYLHVTDDTDSVPLFYIDDGGSLFGQVTNGGDLTIAFNADGIAHFKNAA